MSNVAVRLLAPRGMVVFRGELSASAVKKSVKAVTGTAIPTVGKTTHGSKGSVLWMSPDELLLLVSYEQVQSSVDRLNADLSGAHVLVENVSDARACFRVEGQGAAQTLARLAPVDMHPDEFKVGDIRRTRLAQVAAAIWRDDTGFDVVCFRSVGDYAQKLLLNAADAPQVPDLF